MSSAIEPTGWLFEWTTKRGDTGFRFYKSLDDIKKAEWNLRAYAEMASTEITPLYSIAALKRPTDAMTCAVEDLDDCATSDAAERVWRDMLKALEAEEQKP